MRAVLLLLVVMAWATCLLGAVGCTAYLATRAVRALSRRQAPAAPIADRPPERTVAALAVFAILMAATALGLAGMVLWWAPNPGPVRSALGLAALPIWAAAAAGLTAAVLRGDRRAAVGAGR